MKYFLHDTNSFNDEKVTELFVNFGYEGLGLFYSALEKLALQEKPIKTDILKYQLKVGKKLEKCWSFMESIGLLSSNNGETFNEQLLKYSEKYKIKKESNAARVAKFRENEGKTENVTHYNSVTDENVTALNESKVNESKVNESNGGEPEKKLESEISSALKKPKKKKAEPIPPKDFDEVRVHCAEKGYDIRDGTAWWEYWTHPDRAWHMKDGKAIVDWRASLRNWTQREFSNTSKLKNGNNGNGIGARSGAWNGNTQIEGQPHPNSITAKRGLGGALAILKRSKQNAFANQFNDFESQDDGARDSGSIEIDAEIIN